ncbi:MAG TPA: EF2563 family selenium-dependent molybdenum hydroxylase system protein [Chloroflexi bacterium]|jgi:xanthine dehydrogenase accessory factor|nr:selenium-dependent molybdenum cofactor biosynthesis protein YqeB [Anaerolineaceae bacterium]HHX08518.1 EF2563 family selenium-dependent molybdenum hydroxylase system protein [Chloroflexota bacterium]
MSPKKKLILIRGGGDLASGVAAVLHRAGFGVVICELPQPLMVRRKVAFAEAVWDQAMQVEEITAELATDAAECERLLQEGKIPVLVDPGAEIVKRLEFAAAVDGRMLKKAITDWDFPELPLIGIGPGFTAGTDCLAVIESNRGPNLAKIIWQGQAEANTKVPGIVHGYGLERVLYSPCEGVVKAFLKIGDSVKKGEKVAEVAGQAIFAPFDGVLRGLLREGISIKAHTKLGDVDPRPDPSLCFRISDKALSIGESVLEVIRILAETNSND